ncbi:MAG: fimbria/pilus periplasmic chaperone [Rickettsiales bacterium]
MHKTIFFLSALATLYAGDADAFRFSPFRASVAPTGPEAAKLFRVENNADRMSAVQVRVQTRSIDEYGQERNDDAGGAFSVYPSQFVMQPKTSRAVRVQWNGGAIPKELAFRVIAEELPVALEKNPPDGGNVAFLVAYRGALFVTPRGADSKLQVTDFSLGSPSAGGKRLLRLELRNDGLRHAFFRDPTVTAYARSGTKTTITDAALMEKLEGQTVPAGGTRKFLLPWSPSLPQDVAKIEIGYDKNAF